MKPGTYPLMIQTKEKLDLTITWRDRDGHPVDLTGCHAQMRLLGSGGSSIASLTDLTGEITLGGQDGSIHLLVSPDPTAALNWLFISSYELIVELRSGEPVVLLEGLVERRG